MKEKRTYSKTEELTIGILDTTVGTVQGGKYYNTQEIGLAKALSVYVKFIWVYKVYVGKGKALTETPVGYDNVCIKYIPVRALGQNGMLPCEKLDKECKTLIYFSDTQTILPRVYRWCKKNDIILMPYIGVTKSHSENRIKKWLVDLLFMRSLKVYRKCKCLTKTERVRDELYQRGVNHIEIAHVGLDTTLCNEEYQKTDKNELRGKYGFTERDKIVLFVGRFCQEKRPIDMVVIFARIYERNPEYKLLMIGNGELFGNTQELITKKGLKQAVRLITQVPNDKMWEIYSMSDYYINLNKQEIFGMALLEAMYYGCLVIAHSAPGPDAIIENGVSGWIVEEDDDIISHLEENNVMRVSAKHRVMEHFTWEKTAETVMEVVRG